MNYMCRDIVGAKSVILQSKRVSFDREGIILNNGIDIILIK